MERDVEGIFSKVFAASDAPEMEGDRITRALLQCFTCGFFT
jgi:hypothetical protein